MSSRSRTSTWQIVISLAVLFTTTLAQSGDGGAVSGNVPASSASSGDTAGAAGSSASSANLSVGATVAIAVVAGLAIVIGVLTAVLFWQAKKRSWTMRETLRRSARRVGTGLKSLASPITPARMTFSPVKTQPSAKDTAGFDQGNKYSSTKELVSNNKSRNTDVDLEKGTAKASAAPVQTGHKTRPSITIPGKEGAGRNLSPQTPIWNKFLGRS